MGRSRHSVSQKLHILQLFQEGHYSIRELCKEFSLNEQTFQVWRMKYEAHGREGLQEASSPKSYSEALKLAAVEDYLHGTYSQMEILAKYNLSSTSMLKNWAKKYTSHNEPKDLDKGLKKRMTRGRKTTFEERIEIVQNCIVDAKNYRATAKRYKVSYQQVYQWVKKFEKLGQLGLQDRRGHSRPTEELSAEDKLRLRIQQMERENERLRAENLFLKKLEEVERRRH